MKSAQALRVLVIEDNEDVAFGTSRLLKVLGCDSEVATSGTAALQMAPGFHPDLMLIDLAMPCLDGYELAGRFRVDPAFDGTPMIAISGYVDADHREQARAAGFDGFVSKPFSTCDLENVCARARAAIDDSNAAIEQSRAAAAESKRMSQRCRIDLDEFWLNRQVDD